MANYGRDLEELGRSIQDAVDRAVKAQDYQKLNQTIRQTVDRAVNAGSEAVRRVAVHQTPKAPPVPRKDVSMYYGNPNGRTAVGILKIVGGGLLTAVFLLALLGSVIMMFTGGDLTSMITSLVFSGLSGWLLLSGIRALDDVSRFKAYRRTLGLKTHCTLDKLARSVNKNEKYVRKDLRKMIDRGLFPEGHLDEEGNSLIISHETYHHYEQSKRDYEQRRIQDTQRKAAAAVHQTEPEVQQILDRGDAFVDQIRRCNDAIPGVEISGKISRMETIVQKIFDRAEAEPEVIPDLQKMMDYYLPMTVKLLNAYAEMDGQPVQGETILASKREIEQTLDTLNIAFEKLLDELFADTAMDISSDISVLNTLLAQEGLTEDDLTKMKKDKN